MDIIIQYLENHIQHGAAVKETVVINSVAKQNIEQKLDIQTSDNNSITSVARKVDVDKEILPPNKLNYFKAKKEHIVEENILLRKYKI